MNHNSRQLRRSNYFNRNARTNPRGPAENARLRRYAVLILMTVVGFTSTILVSTMHNNLIQEINDPETTFQKEKLEKDWPDPVQIDRDAVQFDSRLNIDGYPPDSLTMGQIDRDSNDGQYKSMQPPQVNTPIDPHMNTEVTADFGSKRDIDKALNLENTPPVGALGGVHPKFNVNDLMREDTKEDDDDEFVEADDENEELDDDKSKEKDDDKSKEKDDDDKVVEADDGGESEKDDDEIVENDDDAEEKESVDNETADDDKVVESDDDEESEKDDDEIDEADDKAKEKESVDNETADDDEVVESDDDEESEKDDDDEVVESDDGGESEKDDDEIVETDDKAKEKELGDIEAADDDEVAESDDDEESEKDDDDEIVKNDDDAEEKESVDNETADDDEVVESDDDKESEKDDDDEVVEADDGVKSEKDDDEIVETDDKVVESDDDEESEKDDDDEVAESDDGGESEKDDDEIVEKDDKAKEKESVDNETADDDKVVEADDDEESEKDDDKSEEKERSDYKAPVDDKVKETGKDDDAIVEDDDKSEEKEVKETDEHGDKSEEKELGDTEAADDDKIMEKEKITEKEEHEDDDTHETNELQGGGDDATPTDDKVIGEKNDNSEQEDKKTDKVYDETSLKKFEIEKGSIDKKYTKKNSEVEEDQEDKKDAEDADKLEEAVDDDDVGEEDKDDDNDNEGELEKSENQKIPTRIALLGERNTGTRWMTEQLKKCFPTIKVKSRLMRWKHWFQDDDKKSHNQVLVIAQFRNIFEWTEAMRNVPHHSPYHLKLGWEEFVTKPWTMKRPKRDKKHKGSDGNVCYEKFRYDQLISCVEGSYKDEEYKKWLKNTGFTSDSDFSGHKPIYELKQDGSGKPFESILEMRAAKIQNFLSVKEWDWVQDSIPVQYEKLLADGTDFLLTQIEEKLQIKRSCKAVPPQTRKRRPLSLDYVQWMKDNVDWESESLIGYTKDENIVIDKEVKSSVELKELKKTK